MGGSTLAEPIRSLVFGGWKLRNGAVCNICPLSMLTPRRFGLEVFTCSATASGHGPDFFLCYCNSTLNLLMRTETLWPVLRDHFEAVSGYSRKWATTVYR